MEELFIFFINKPNIKEKNILNASLEVCHNFETFKEGLQRAVETELVKARVV